MTSLLIKSYNRPHYLARCLYSVQQFVTSPVEVTVLDDGTPQKYLDKIKNDFPFVKFKDSPSAPQKRKAVEENLLTGKNIDGFGIPTSLWVEAVKEASEYFIITEDDVWFTQPVDLDELTLKMKAAGTELLKLGWLGNQRALEWNRENPLDDEIIAQIPQEMPTGSAWQMDWYFKNRFKVFTLLYKMGIVNNETKLRYWVLNSIMMGLWHRDYWLHVWKDVKEKVDERQQLINAAAYYHRRKKNPAFTARTRQEIMKTTFQSSSTNSYHAYGDNFDVNLFNHLLNEAWFQDRLDITENFPHDFSQSYLESFIQAKMDVTQFRAWRSKFQKQYADMGCEVE